MVFTTEQPSTHVFGEDVHVLIVDRAGIVGRALAEELGNTQDRCNLVIVSKSQEAFHSEHVSIEYIPWEKRLPTIPSHRYSYMFVVYNNEREILGALAQFAQKAREDGAKLILAVSMFFASEAFLKECKEVFEKLLLLIYGDVVEENVPFSFPKRANLLFSQAKREGRVTIANMGMQEVYPVFLSDVVSAFVQLGFVDHGSERVFFAFPRHPLTELSMARIIKKIHPLIKIDFIEEKQSGEEATPPIPRDGVYLVEENYPFEQKLKSLWSLEKQSEKDEDEKAHEVRRGERFPFFFLLAFLFAVFACTFPLLWILLFSFLGEKLFVHAKEQLKRGDIVSFEKAVRASHAFLSLADTAFSIASFEASFVGKADVLAKFGMVSEKKQRTNGLLFGAVGLSRFRSVLTGESSNPRVALDAALANFREMNVSFGRLRGYGKTSRFDEYDSVASLIDLLVGSSDVAPLLLGFEKPTRYLLLFQDNEQLRPGGGVVTGYGLVRFEKGKVTDFSLHDTSEVDEHLKGHVEPPFPLRRYQQSVHWYLRDSSFSPDVVSVASKAALLLRLGTNETVDGVVGIDTTFVEGLLALTGPILVPRYNETVRAENLSALMDAHGGENVLGEVFQHATKAPLLTIAAHLTQAISQKHLTFAFANQHAQALFALHGASPCLCDVRKDEDDVVRDTFGLIDASLGNVRVGRFVKRKVSREVTLDKNGTLLARAILLYENTSEQEAYKNYLYLVMPSGATITSISFESTSQKLISAVTDPSVYEGKKFTPPSGLEVETIQKGDTMLVGFFFLVPERSKKEIVVTYVLPKRIGANRQSFSYNLLLFKQLGTKEEPIRFSFLFPTTFTLSRSTDGFSFDERGATIAMDIVRDTQLRLDFARE